MQRSSSFANVKIEFNPREMQVGTSSIDKLPIRKSNSSKSITQISQNQQRLALQSQQYSIQMLKRINQSLQRQNAYLKKQLDFFTQACSSRRASLNNIVGVVGKKKQESGYKDKILSRLQSKIDKNDTQSTGLFNSKISSGRKPDQIQQQISEMYTKYNLKKVLPNPQTIKKLTNNFLQSIKQNYLKLKIVVDQIQLNSKSKEAQKLPAQTIDILGYLQMTVLYCKNPKVGKTILKQKQAARHSKKQITRSQKVEEMLNQCSSSASDLIAVFQSLVKIGIKNVKFIAQLKNNIGFARLIKKINEK